MATWSALRISCSTDHRVTAQTVLDQVRGQVAAAAPLVKRMTLEIIHHTPRQGDIDPLRTCGIRHFTGAGNRRRLLESLLQLEPQLLEN